VASSFSLPSSQIEKMPPTKKKKKKKSQEVLDRLLMHDEQISEFD
jgi:hypothetical protein